MTIAKFISGDGVEHAVDTESQAFRVMSKDGSFTRTDSEPIAVSGEQSEDATVDLSKLNRDALIAEAAKLGITIDAADKAQTKKVIVAQIEAKQAEEPASEPTE